MRTEDFAFDLPDELIAQRPVQPRDAARLLWVGGELQDKSVLDLPQILRPGDLLVLNDTQVIPARLFGKRGEAKIEVTLHQAADDATWRAFARPAKKLKAGDRLDFPAGLSAEVAEKGEAGEVNLSFPYGGERLLLALSRSGAIPLPPYIRKGRADERDNSDYQTLFAAKPGAVAAPTASLHFTPRLMDALKARGVDFTIVTLHVGAGTFLPVKVEDPRLHKMYGEWGEIGQATADKINRTRQSGGRIVAVGTTALRLIEAAANDKGEVPPFSGEVKLFILPGYRFKVADLLMTNFHLPRSTLFMLVSAFAGLARMRKAYEHAIAKGYRFYSYGDSSLLQRERLA